MTKLFEIQLPERAGCILLMTRQAASNGVNSLTTFLISSLLVNREGYCFRKMMRTREKKSPITNEDRTTTTTENFAVLGCAAPSSFDTLTLQRCAIFKNNTP